MSLRNGLFLVLFFLLLGLPRTARAAGESVTSQLLGPERFFLQNGKYVDVTGDSRPQNLNPAGVSFSDCEHDLRLDFGIAISGFEPTDGAHLEVWAGVIDCTQDANRNQVSSAEAHPCWQVASNTGPLNSPGIQGMTISVFARDVLRYEQPPTAGTAQVYETGFHDGSGGESACHAQTNDAVVPLMLTFLPVNAAEQAIGTAWQYNLVTDLVAPAPPSGVSASGSVSEVDTTWTSASPDPDRIGFAMWIAPAQSGGCGSPELQGQDWVLPSGDGISVFSAQNLGGEVYDSKATTLQATGTHGTRYAAVVTSIDGSGNYGPPSSAACAEPEAPVGTEPLAKGGCACAAADDRSAGWLPVLAALAMVVTLTRRRASRGCSIEACARTSAS